MFCDPRKIQTEGANQIRVFEKVLSDDFCMSQGITVKDIFPRGSRKKGVKHHVLARSLFLLENKPEGGGGGGSTR